MDIKSSLPEIALHNYVDSPDFNGFNFSSYCEQNSIEINDYKEDLRELISEDKIVLRLDEEDLNPAIKRFPDRTKDQQLEILSKSQLKCVFVYPSNKLLSDRLDKSKFEGKPYTLALALGEAHLDYHSFDLSVLEHYRNDPRYYYKADDVHGAIYMKDEEVSKGYVHEKDDVFMQTFGFSYDENMNRSVAVFTWYLHGLSAEHQQLWAGKELTVRGTLHPDYFRTSIQGLFPEYIPVLTAFTMELHAIREMSELMGRRPLFRKSFLDQEKPANFTFLIRPTLKEFNDFVLLLDQMMSDNIDKKFFGDDVSLKEEIPIEEGKVEIRQKGTIAILADWFNKCIIPDNQSEMEEIILTFRKVRKLRQKPAHSPTENEFDNKYFTMQRELIIEAYKAIRRIRLILKNHSACRTFEVDPLLYEGKIRTF